MLQIVEAGSKHRILRSDSVLLYPLQTQGKIFWCIQIFYTWSMAFLRILLPLLLKLSCRSERSAARVFERSSFRAIRNFSDFLSYNACSNSCNMLRCAHLAACFCHDLMIQRMPCRILIFSGICNWHYNAICFCHSKVSLFESLFPNTRPVWWTRQISWIEPNP